MTKLLVYSDLHLEFGTVVPMPNMDDGDILVLAGDICNFCNYEKVKPLFDHWTKPIVYVAGNHEYYYVHPTTEIGEEIVSMSMKEMKNSFKDWITKYYPQVHFLVNESWIYDDIHFFGGTMWTDINKGDCTIVNLVQSRMNDYKCIFSHGRTNITPEDVMIMHKEFKEKLDEFLTFDNELPTSGHKTSPFIPKRVIVTHHAPITPVRSIRSFLHAAYIANMNTLIADNHLDAWIYGHTHSVDDQWFHNCHVVSNPRGYQSSFNYDPRGKLVQI